jgi:2',3'-cyclic-nucleotide 2'-phosphodiesterase (5'-nucleotidase family)
LLLDSGDALIGGGVLGDSTQGEAVVAGMNLMGYNAMALGPKELSLGAEVLRQRLAEAEFPILSANVVSKDGGELVALPYDVLEAGPYRVGVIGLTRPTNEALADFQVLDPQEAAARAVPEVTAQTDVVILLTNLEYRPALALVEAVPGVDLVIAALPGQLPNQAVRLPATGTLAVTAEQPLQRHTGRRVGRLAVTVGSDGTLAGEEWASVEMGPRIADDPEMRALLERYRSR